MPYPRDRLKFVAQGFMNIFPGGRVKRESIVGPTAFKVNSNVVYVKCLHHARSSLDHSITHTGELENKFGVKNM